jgi:hypothetical protein
MRAVSEVASSAIEAIGQKTSSLVESASRGSFASVLAGTSAEADATPTDSASAGELTTIGEIREKLSGVIESVLDAMGVTADPALRFVAGSDGMMHLETPHPRAAEIEANLRDDEAVRNMAAKLTRSELASDRTLVLHSVAGL